MAVARRLLKDAWPVRALARDQMAKKARVLAHIGGQVVRGDFEDPRSLEHVRRALMNRDTRSAFKSVAERGTGTVMGIHVTAANASDVVRAAVQR